jgi:hypothetical protein
LTNSEKAVTIPKASKTQVYSEIYETSEDKTLSEKPNYDKRCIL